MDTDALVTFVADDFDTESLLVGDENGQYRDLSEFRDFNDDIGISYNPNQFRFPKGKWSIRINGEFDDEGFALVDHYMSPHLLMVTEKYITTDSGNKITITANVSDNVEGANENEVIQGRVIPIENAVVTAEITNPGGKKRSIRLKDSGDTAGDGDENKGDHIFSTKISVNAIGASEISLTVVGIVANAPFKRSLTAHVAVDGTRLKLIRNPITATQGTVLGQVVEGDRYGLPLKLITVRGNMPEYLNTRAEVWAKDWAGNDLVVG